MELDEILTKAVKLGASDIHLKVGSVPKARIKTVVRSVEGFDIIKPEDMIKFISKILAGSESKKNELIKNGETDLSYSIQSLSRFRVNILKQRGTYAIVLRVIKTEPPKFENLILPEVIKKIAEEPIGLVLVTGPTGSGKSTTLAAMINYRNENFEDTIITIEEPVEYVFKDKKAYIIQREVGMDTQSFNSGLRAALREDPDVIMVARWEI